MFERADLSNYQSELKKKILLSYAKRKIILKVIFLFAFDKKAR